MKTTHLPCPCGKSSDAYAIYTDKGKCYSCGKVFWNDNGVKTNLNYTMQQISYRGHSVSSLQKYDVKLKVAEDGEILEVHYPYEDATKIRKWPKGFTWENYKGHGLFGRDKFQSGSALAVTITEGEEDTLSAYEMLGSKYPVVSVQSASQAGKDCSKDKEWLDAFEKIYLDFDEDEAGKRAIEAVSALFPFNKVYIVKKTKYKDANEYLINNQAEEYRRAWWAAKRHDPENIVSSFGDIAKILSAPKKKAICTFPFKELQDGTYGIRTGETYLFKALEGIGKTELLGAIEYHAAKTQDFPIGIIHLEEDTQRAAFRLVGYEVEEPVHLEGHSDYTLDALMDIYTRVAKQDNRINFYQQGKNDTDATSFLNAIRFMVASAGCKIVFFDHISRVASAFNLDTSGLDNFATNLSKMALELDFALLMITHVNDDGLTRGSRNISKEAWTVISLTRDKLSPDPITRNTTHLVIEKNRHAAITGPAGSVYFNPITFKITDTPPIQLPPTE